MINTDFIPGLIGIILVGVVSRVFWGFVGKRVKEDLNSNVIKQPSLYIYIGLLGMAASVGFIILAISLNIDDMIKLSGALFFFVVLFLLCLYIFLNNLNWKLELKEDECVHTNFIGRKRTYKYIELRVVNVNSGFRVYYKKRRIFDVSVFQDNWRALPEFYKKHGKIEIRISNRK